MSWIGNSERRSRGCSQRPNEASTNQSGGGMSRLTGMGSSVRQGGEDVTQLLPGGSERFLPGASDLPGSTSCCWSGVAAHPSKVCRAVAELPRVSGESPSSG
ncbi:MAG: hypothetical protein ACYDGY_07225 [Acidimicrobiales bacterium]